jgi:hypothetical protein
VDFNEFIREKKEKFSMDSNEFIRENNIKFSTDSDDREGKK